MTAEQNLIEQAEKAAQRLESANKQTADQLAKLEKLEAIRQLGGFSEAGKPQEVQMSKEDKDKMDMKRYFKGTALERAFK